MSKEIEDLVARRLWKVFEFELPDTPHRVVRVMLKELENQGFKITKGETNATDQQ
jgi:hypothetical protein